MKIRFKSLRIYFIPIFFLLILSSKIYGQTEERITSFQSDIQVHFDATMTVTETITVQATGASIKHGIYRDFPMRYKDPMGNSYVVGFDIEKISRDGFPEEYFLKEMSNGTRVYIGKKDTLLQPGQYTYTIVYDTNRQLGFFKEFDELYWNVTGNGWEFPIDQVTATVELPEGASDHILQTDAYTGYSGSKEKNFISSKDILKNTFFKTTRPLRAREGLTIVLEWPKGFVQEPSAFKKASYILHDNRGLFLGLVGLIVTLLFYSTVWNQVGRDPAKGTIIPLYEPPEHFSPAVVRYILKMGYDPLIFTVTVIDLAVKGFLTINEDSKRYTLTRNASGGSTLAAEETELGNTLFAGKDQVVLENSNHAQIQISINSLKIFLNKKCEKIYFLTNRKYFIFGLLISIATIWVSIGMQSKERMGMAVFIGIWLSIWSVGISGMLGQVFNLWKTVFHPRSAKELILIGPAVFVTLFAIPFIIGEFFGIGLLTYAVSVPTTIVLAMIVSLNILFYNLLKAPTFQGRKIMDQIEGFKMFISATENDHAHPSNPTQLTPELFEKYLPYAVALGVEGAWAQKFSEVLANVSKPGEGYSPVWYSSSTHSYWTPSTFSSSLSHSFSTAISAAAVAPSSSSGGGGGGSSGGGGGGGGGGGW